MPEKKSNWLIPVGIGAAAVIAGGATLGYLYLRGAFSDVSPLASAKIVPDEALMAGFVSPYGRKRFLQAFERKMNDEFTHPVFDYRCTYRRAIELQARLLSRYLQEGITYKPLVLR